jgi:N12 class adenine-specific DNA methylase
LPEQRKENLEVKIKTLTEQIKNRTDDVVDFKLMGIDHVFVDESHKFKNLLFNIRHNRVAGLGNPIRKLLHMERGKPVFLLRMQVSRP